MKNPKYTFCMEFNLVHTLIFMKATSLLWCHL